MAFALFTPAPPKLELGMLTLIVGFGLAPVPTPAPAPNDAVRAADGYPNSPPPEFVGACCVLPPNKFKLICYSISCYWLKAQM